QGSESVGDAGDQYTGLDRFGRIVDIRWLKTSTGAAVDRFKYGFDRASNRTWRSNLVAPNQEWGEKYAYDGLYQVNKFQRGTLSGDSITGITWDEEFDYDPAGNWEGYAIKVPGVPDVSQSRTHNLANEILTITNPT